MDVKIRVVLLIFVLSILYVLSKGLVDLGDRVSKGLESKGAKTDTADNKGMTESLRLKIADANYLSKLPLGCIQNPLPYKSGIVISDSSDLAMPQEHHPAFYGCFDWHSAVHGHWSLVFLMKQFPNLENQDSIRKVIDKNLTKANIAKEIEYFSLNKYSKSFERTYGWAWLLKLSEELYTWDDPDAKRWFEALEPLNKLLSQKYQDYLPKLVYPIRLGTHTNTAFGLSFAYDYASTVGDSALVKSISTRAKDFYFNDKGCPLSWEPSGYDFLSPCLQEVDIMRKVLSDKEFASWINEFLPSFADGTFYIKPAEVLDRSDGHLVHLDGVNFSRAWCLYPIVDSYPYVEQIANENFNFSIDKIVDGDYMGEHWLASFALYAYQQNLNNSNN